jgi:diaminopimelate epimerase
VLRLTKHHGLGNDFLIALESRNPGVVPVPDVARQLCDRRRGVGADGLIIGLAPAEQGHDACMVLLNADGSEAEISGNGIRCLAQALLRDSGRNEGRLQIETAAGVRDLQTVRGEVDGELWLRVDMGEVRSGPEPGPVTTAYGATRRQTLDLGNPHLVLLVDDLAAVDLDRDGPLLEAEYPAGINVHMVQVMDRRTVSLRVWERGVGITEACGSGAAAAAVATHRWGLADNRIRVVMPGGESTVDVDGDRVLLTGPTEFVAEVSVP